MRVLKHRPSLKWTKKPIRIGCGDPLTADIFDAECIDDFLGPSAGRIVYSRSLGDFFECPGIFFIRASYQPHRANDYIKEVYLFRAVFVCAKIIPRLDKFSLGCIT